MRVQSEIIDLWLENFYDPGFRVRGQLHIDWIGWYATLWVVSSAATRTTRRFAREESSLAPEFVVCSNVKHDDRNYDSIDRGTRIREDQGAMTPAEYNYKSAEGGESTLVHQKHNRNCALQRKEMEANDQLLRASQCACGGCK